MDTKLTFKYDREADILYIDKWPPYAEQESEELGTCKEINLPKAACFARKSLEFWGVLNLATP